MQITTEDIKVISRLVHDLCGIVLDESKGYLIESRLSRVANEAGCETFSELYYKTRYKQNPAIEKKIIDAITTNETLFFRDTSPFEALQFKVLPEMIDEKANSRNPKRLRLWSAACSTGQEPYSLAMTLAELIPDIHSWDVNILATDISSTAIAQASRGTFEKLEIQRGMKPTFLAKYFDQTEGTYRVKDQLRSLIRFQQINLLQPFVGMGPFDIVFCRNVAIYFSAEARKDLFERITQLLTPSGCLFVGSSESLLDLGSRFTPHRHCRAVFYRPRMAQTAPC